MRQRPEWFKSAQCRESSMSNRPTLSRKVQSPSCHPELISGNAPHWERERSMAFGDRPPSGRNCRRRHSCTLRSRSRREPSWYRRPLRAGISSSSRRRRASGVPRSARRRFVSSLPSGRSRGGTAPGRGRRRSPATSSPRRAPPGWGTGRLRRGSRTTCRSFVSPRPVARPSLPIV